MLSTKAFNSQKEYKKDWLSFYLIKKTVPFEKMALS